MSKKPGLPGLTPLQFAVLSALADGERSGREVRSALSAAGIDKIGPAFYQMMARMGVAGLVTGRYVRATIDGQDVTERRYRITAKGRRMRDETVEFYAGLSGRLGAVGKDDR